MLWNLIETQLYPVATQSRLFSRPSNECGHSGFQQAAVKNYHPNDHLLKSSHTGSQAVVLQGGLEKKHIPTSIVGLP